MAQVGALQVASAGSQIWPVGQVWSTSVLLVQEWRVVELLQTQAESGAHCTHLPGVPAHRGVVPVQVVSTQLPAVEQVLSVLVLAHLGAAVAGSQPLQAPPTHAALVPVQATVAKAPALQ